jgi:hypothetical protein
LSCAAYFNNYLWESTALNVIYSQTFTLTTGYNKLYLTPSAISVTTGYFIQLIQATGQVAIDTSGTNAPFADMYLNNGLITKLNYVKNLRFYLNALTSLSYYQNSISIAHTYVNSGTYTLSVAFLSSGVTYTQTINIADSNIPYLNNILA